MRRSAIGFLYVISVPALGISKVGCSTNPHKRIKSILSGSGIDDKDCTLFVSKRTKDMFVSERDAHIFLSDKRKKGEWFFCGFSEAKEVVESCIDIATDDFVSKELARIDESSSKFQQAIKTALFPDFELRHTMTVCNSIVSACSCFQESLAVLTDSGMNEDDARYVANEYAKSLSGMDATSLIGVCLIPPSTDIIEQGLRFLVDNDKIAL